MGRRMKRPYLNIVLNGFDHDITLVLDDGRKITIPAGATGKFYPSRKKKII